MRITQPAKRLAILRSTNALRRFSGAFPGAGYHRFGWIPVACHLGNCPDNRTSVWRPGLTEAGQSEMAAAEQAGLGSCRSHRMRRTTGIDPTTPLVGLPANPGTGRSAPCDADGCAPMTAVQTSGTVFQKRSFMGAAANGWVWWLADLASVGRAAPALTTERAQASLPFGCM